MRSFVGGLSYGSSHLKAVVLVYWRGGQRWVVGASLGRAYADEGRLLAQWLERYGSGVVGSGALLVGDKLYGIGVGCWLWSRLGGCLWRVWKQVRQGVHPLNPLTNGRSMCYN
jgi:hypothetical protein